MMLMRNPIGIPMHALLSEKGTLVPTCMVRGGWALHGGRHVRGVHSRRGPCPVHVPARSAMVCERPAQSLLSGLNGSLVRSYSGLNTLVYKASPAKLNTTVKMRPPTRPMRPKRGLPLPELTSTAPSSYGS